VHVALGDLPTWTAAGAAVLALAAGWGSFVVLRRQLEEQRNFNRTQGEVLSLQGEELLASAAERRRDASERRRLQASQVYAERHLWERDLDGVVSEKDRVAGGDVPILIYVVNGSALPIYDVDVRWYKGTAPWNDVDGVAVSSKRYLAPGKELGIGRDWIGDGNLNMVGAVVEFRDAAGVRWRRTTNGELEELPG
jgi:hypothetical protein